MPNEEKKIKYYQGYTEDEYIKKLTERAGRKLTPEEEMFIRNFIFFNTALNYAEKPPKKKPKLSSCRTNDK